VDLKAEGKGDHNEHLVIFRNSASPNLQQILVKISTFRNRNSNNLFEENGFAC
jgi:hypothetical protein